MAVAIGLRERALAEYEAAEERRERRERLITDGALARQMHFTEELLRDVLGIETQAPGGAVMIDRMTIGARWVRVNGHTAWRLCLIEDCAVCGRSVLTPFASRSSLGAILAQREGGVEAAHPVEGDCIRRRAIGGTR